MLSQPLQRRIAPFGQQRQAGFPVLLEQAAIAARDEIRGGVVGIEFECFQGGLGIVISFVLFGESGTSPNDLLFQETILVLAATFWARDASRSAASNRSCSTALAMSIKEFSANCLL